jgi:hypothetical protein
MNRPRVLILDDEAYPTGDKPRIYFGRYFDRVNFDCVVTETNLLQWLKLDQIMHDLLIITPLPWRWRVPPSYKLLNTIRQEKKYTGPIIVVSMHGNWWRPLVEDFQAVHAGGPGLVSDYVGHLLFGDPKPT